VGAEDTACADVGTVTAAVNVTVMPIALNAMETSEFVARYTKYNILATEKPRRRTAGAK
jgi:hypothetical protein